MVCNLKDEIVYLISLRQEGPYWDYKREWYGREKKGDMLHDIICMANNLVDRDAYIIIGVDEGQNYSVVDVSSDQNRRKTQELVCFLRDKHFVGDMRPIVQVQALELDDGCVDVIVIKNSRTVPFYITDRFQSNRANYIYTRIQDTNTPVDKQADLNCVEYLWRKRFGLNDTPWDKFQKYLVDYKNWENEADIQSTAKYYKYDPAYKILEVDSPEKTAIEYYVYAQCDHSCHWCYLQMYYYQTSVKQFVCVNLDGCRCLVVVPKWSCTDIVKDGTIRYCYYIEDSVEYLLSNFLQYDRNSLTQFNCHMSYILLFKCEEEKKQFDLFVAQNVEMYNILFQKQDRKCEDKIAEKDIRNVLVLQQMLKEFRKSNQE